MKFLAFQVDFQTLEVDLILWVANFRPYVRPQKVSSISMKFCVQVVHDHDRHQPFAYNAQQGQGQGQEPMKVGNSTILDHFQTIFSPIYNGG